ncbi:dienelactone hydrolase family protein [Microlunatus sp. Gsoil 973]|uniref:dienelactone hydrolase family protein n=1 Tax=Microlunatus sp. Gsoil 973 TaxID=2672569 RepID=UPI0012B47249|nr:dienelactone hydrolase family protein [Microlunatus sp. Gsoil 973]QGN32622.1 alpha/beta fold hydrolase [Microlunatus sp. Gsoil 973]
MDVVIFHSMYGLRPVELAAASRIRALGHRVVVPDLFDGETVPGDVEAGSRLMSSVGWPTIVGRAADALTQVSDEAVLIGFSMGVGVIGQLWPHRTAAAAVACLHAPTLVPQGLRRGMPVQLHVGIGDRFAPAEQVMEFLRSAEEAGATPLIGEYPRAGHMFMDDSLEDYDAAAAAATWQALVGMLDTAEQ